jgi:hypothetical protein
MEYLVRRAHVTPELQGNWDGAAWRDADVAPITHFHAKSSAHRPAAQAKMLFDDRGLYLMFHVHDRYVLCRRTRPQESVCKDSCVEAFLQPRGESGYFNFEVNCGGTILLYYIHDFNTRQHRELAPELIEKIRIYHSMPAVVPVEIEQPTQWTVEYFVPNEVFEAHVGPLGAARERRWRGNFYKCADESSHPHWASWSPIGEQLTFHDPKYFAPIRFAD